MTTARARLLSKKKPGDRYPDAGTTLVTDKRRRALIALFLYRRSQVGPQGTPID